MKYILSIDQGTTGTTCALIDSSSLSLVAKFNREHKQIYPKPGMVEHDLDEIWSNTQEVIAELLKEHHISGGDISAIGITNQRETTCAFDKLGKPLANAIVWQDRRTADFCAKLKKEGKASLITSKTGLPVDPYFSATKMHWLLENNAKVKSAAASGDLHFGTIDTYLLYRLTGGMSYLTESSNASRTLLMDLESCQWSRELLNIFNIEKSYLPVIVDSFANFGITKGLSVLPDGIPIAGILGDQQAALFGQAGIHQGDVKCTYGTGAFMLLNTGEDIARSKNGLLSTVAYMHQGEAVYALEGSCYIAGAAVQWLRDNLNLIDASAQVEELAKQVTNLEQMEYLLFLPFFTGMGSPHWNSDAKAAIVGITRDSSSIHLARACLDGIALSINDLLTVMKEDTKLPIQSMRVDGGAVANNLLMHIQATLSQTEIIRPKVIETTAYGAALAAAVGVGALNIQDIPKLWQKDKSFDPRPSESAFYQRKQKQWKETMSRLYGT